MSHVRLEVDTVAEHMPSESRRLQGPNEDNGQAVRFEGAESSLGLTYAEPVRERVPGSNGRGHFTVIEVRPRTHVWPGRVERHHRGEHAIEERDHPAGQVGELPLHGPVVGARFETCQPRADVFEAEGANEEVVLVPESLEQCGL